MCIPRRVDPIRLARVFAWTAAVVSLTLGPSRSTWAQSSSTSASPISVGVNVNMVGGPASLSQGPPLAISGDPYLQRQNEPSLACSSRNPVNCLAAANDYRLVGTPGVQDGRVTGDAWLGIFWSHDEGQTWRSSLLPGYPQDTSAAGLASPVAGLGAAADPTVRPGTNGLFYVSGVAFNRPGESTGNGGKAGVMFVSTYIDDNNTQVADAPIRYVRTVIVDNGSSGQFLDKPWIATDIPRAGAGSCTIPGSNGVPDQTVPAGNVYVAYSVFLGSGNNQHAKILFTRSTDCGRTWSSPIKLNESFQETSQSAIVTVNPTNGSVLVAWRQFGDANYSDPGRILVAQSFDFGNTFAKTITVASLGLANQPSPASPTNLAFDQPTLPVAGDPAPTQRMFRTNGYPSACIDTSGLYRIVWAQRWGSPTGPSRIVMSASTDGASWSAPAPVDGSYTGPGHQFMPSIACTANRASVIWYDQRYDNAAGVFGPLLFGYFIVDLIPPPPAHTLDVRAAQTDPQDPSGMSYLPSVQVSRYQWAWDSRISAATGKPNGLVQLEYNPVNWPLFAGGTTPFLGDYIELAPARVFRAPFGANGWTYNSDANDAGVMHAVWTDNRDIFNQANSDNWSTWSPPGTPGCTDSIQASKRNQNVYTSRLSSGLVVGVEGNSRLVAGSVSTRAFAAFVQNATGITRRFKLSATGVQGSTAWLDPNNTTAPLYADIGPYSTIARTIFVPATQTTPVVLTVVEVDTSNNPVPTPLSGSAVVNSDGTAPPPIDGTVATAEYHTPTISAPVVNQYASDPSLGLAFAQLAATNPTFINPTFINPTFINPTFINPTFINPTFINPTFINPTFINPTFINPTFINQPYLSDISWQVSNTGNVASGFNVSALLASVPANAVLQLIISRLYPTPGATNCGLGQMFSSDIQAVINNPALTPAAGGNPLSSDVTNATFALAAGDSAIVTLRVAHDGSFDPQAATLMSVAQAANPSGAASATAGGAPAFSVPRGGITGEAAGPNGVALTYQVTAIDPLTAEPLTVTCSPLSGSTFPLGSTTVSCAATGANGVTGTAAFGATVTDKTPPTVTVPAGLSTQATSAAGATVVFGATTASDTVDGTLAVTCTPASGSVFAIGSTTVNCTATDKSGNTGSASFVVTVVDTTPPVLTLPGNMTVEAVSTSGAPATFVATAADLVSGAVTPVCGPASGATFAFGLTVVACTATDGAGNTASGSFTVSVVDTTPPALTLPANITVNATSASGAVVTFAATAVDRVDGALMPACSPVSGTTFPIGVTTVTCTVKDSHNNVASGAFLVSVLDRVPPAVTEIATPNSLLWSPNKTMTPVTVSGTASDWSKLSPAIAYNVVDEYGYIQPSGTATLSSTGSFSFTVSLEAWRKGTDSSGRVYTIYATVTDSYGNKTVASTIVLVPHN